MFGTVFFEFVINPFDRGFLHACSFGRTLGSCCFRRISDGSLRGNRSRLGCSSLHVPHVEQVALEGEQSENQEVHHVEFGAC